MENTEEIIKNKTKLVSVNTDFDIDYTKIKTVEDIKTLFKSVELFITLTPEVVGQCKEAIEKGFLIERKK